MRDGRAMDWLCNDLVISRGSLLRGAHLLHNRSDRTKPANRVHSCRNERGETAALQWLSRGCLSCSGRCLQLSKPLTVPHFAARQLVVVAK